MFNYTCIYRWVRECACVRKESESRGEMGMEIIFCEHSGIRALGGIRRVRGNSRQGDRVRGVARGVADDVGESRKVRPEAAISRGPSLGELSGSSALIIECRSRNVSAYLY
jgi:hypothetical protein